MQINKRIEEILPMGGHVPLDTTERKKMILSLLHDFSREVVGEVEEVPEPVFPFITRDRAIYRNQLKHKQLERADKLLEDK